MPAAKKDDDNKMAEEDEFAARDAMGLKKASHNDDGSSKPPKSESQTLNAYLLVNATILFVVSPLLTLGLLGVVTRVWPAVATQHLERIALLRRSDLGWIYLAWYVLCLARSYATINANGTREAARVNRPDQHAYRIMAAANSSTKNGDVLANAPYVLMENVGPVGRFNRAQRAAFHMDEGLELLVTGILLAGVILPQLVFGLVCLYAVGRILYTNSYTASLEGRMNTMILWALPQFLLTALVLIFAVQSLVPNSTSDEREL